MSGDASSRSERAAERTVSQSGDASSRSERAAERTVSLTAWEPALDALEEWVRQTAEGLMGPEPKAPSTPPSLPEGLAPDDLQLRMRVLIERIHEVEAAVLQRREQLRREQAYGAA